MSDQPPPKRTCNGKLQPCLLRGLLAARALRRWRRQLRNTRKKRRNSVKALQESNMQQREDSLFDDSKQLGESVQQECRQKGTDTCYLGTGVAKKCLLHLLHGATGVLRNRTLRLGQAASSVKVATEDWERRQRPDRPHALWQRAPWSSTSRSCLLSSSAALALPGLCKCPERKRRCSPGARGEDRR